MCSPVKYLQDLTGATSYQLQSTVNHVNEHPEASLGEGEKQCARAGAPRRRGSPFILCLRFGHTTPLLPELRSNPRPGKAVRGVARGVGGGGGEHGSSRVPPPPLPSERGRSGLSSREATESNGDRLTQSSHHRDHAYFMRFSTRSVTTRRPFW